MKKLLRFLRNYRKECILGPLFKMLEALFELLIPLVVASVIDQGIAHGDKPYVIRCALLMILLGMIGWISAITAQYFSAKAAVGFSAEARHALFGHIQSLSFSALNDVGSSTLIARLTNDMNQAQAGVNFALRLLLRSPFIVFGAMIMAFTVDKVSALIFCAAIPVLGAVVYLIMRFCIPRYGMIQKALDTLLNSTRENLFGVRVIRAFGHEKEELKRFSADNDALTALQLFVGRFAAVMNPLTFVIINSAIVCLIWLGAIRVNLGILTQGQVVALVNYMSQILVELIKLANLIVTMNKAWACGNRIQAIFDIPSDPAKQNDQGQPLPAETTGRPFLEFDHVSFSYADAETCALKDIHFSVKKGQTIGIIGGAGSGKTTLVNLLPRFFDATDGAIFMNGVDLREISVHELRRNISVVMQRVFLFKGTIRENLLWGNPDASDAEIKNALNVSQAAEFVEKLEKGIDSPVEQDGRNLSGGQKQRLTIARAIIRRPKLLILDDSASALDMATDAALREAISQMDKEMTIFIVSQRTAAIRSADQIIALENGEIAGIGSHEQLLRSSPVYQEIYYSQFQKEEK